VAAKYILAIVAACFLIAAIRRVAYDAGRFHAKTRTWLLVGSIFAVVSAFLFWRQ
jgi:hypothetical protein